MRARARARDNNWRSEDGEGEDKSEADRATWGNNVESETTWTKARSRRERSEIKEGQSLD
jgi:hypothetical protein